MPSKKQLILVAGGSGSGKTYIANMMYEQLGREEGCLVFPGDAYWRDKQWVDEHLGGNYDDIRAMDWELLLDHLSKLLAGHIIDVPVYDMKISSRADKTTPLAPRPTIIIDTLLGLAVEALREMADVTVYVHTDENIRLQRRTTRDEKERGRPPERTLAQWPAVLTCHNELIEPNRDRAVLEINNNVESVYPAEKITAFRKLISEILQERSNDDAYKIPTVRGRSIFDFFAYAKREPAAPIAVNEAVASAGINL